MNRVSLLNTLIKRYSLEYYLEIGCDRNKTFQKVGAKNKAGVDPHRGGTHRMSSDAFFEQYDQHFDLVFIDGLHHASQVLMDVQNAYFYLNKPGFIILHDCLPTSERSQAIVDDKGQGIYSPNRYTGSAWYGDVWKAMAAIRTWHHVDSVTINCDCGLGIIIDRSNTLRAESIKSYESLTWDDYCRKRNKLLRVIQPDELDKWLP